MAILGITLFPLLFASQGGPINSGPSGVICFAVANSSSPLPISDVPKIKLLWKSKTYTKLESGNYGVFKNGCYYIISKDVPLLKGLRDRFDLTSRIIELAKDGRSKICQTSIKGQEFSETQINTLNRLVEHWSGMRY